MLYSPAPAVAEVALAALADDLSQQAHEQFLELLNSLVHGEGTDLPEACERLASRGIWLLYRELALDRSINATATAFELLATLEPDRDRLRRAQIALGESLPWDYRPGMLNDPLDSSATDE
ncbi:hypothetical protein ActroDRAFT_0084 [Actinospica robiniae DSM 44927]|uniref:Uncharacterized protein n=1 Tax=Actinospica robiniae DSM 44927 TaxID=479430 RepID=W9DZ39_9ACTN|nr:hypothetical protein ActroDRAFT_0084 [Actinospica robiniae DSM 44927]